MKNFFEKFKEFCNKFGYILALIVIIVVIITPFIILYFYFKSQNKMLVLRPEIKVVDIKNNEVKDEGVFKESVTIAKEILNKIKPTT